MPPSATSISERIKNEQLWQQVEAPTPSICRSSCPTSVIEALRGKRKELVTEYQEKLETFKPGYPAMVQIKNKIDEIDRQLATEVRTIKDSLKAAYETSLAQEDGDAEADRGAAAGDARSAEAQHPIQHPEARGRHQPLAL